MSPRKLNVNDIYNIVVKTVNKHNGWMHLTRRGELILFAFAYKNGDKSRIELIPLIESKLYKLIEDNTINNIHKFFENVFLKIANLMGKNINEIRLLDYGIYDLVITTINEYGGWAFLSRQEQMELFAHTYKNGNKSRKKLIKCIENKSYRLSKDTISYSIKRFCRRVFLRTDKYRAVKIK